LLIRTNSKPLADAPAPPPGEGPVLMWHRSSRNQTVLYAFSLLMLWLLLAWLRGPFSFALLAYWWAYVVPVAIVVLSPFAMRKTYPRSAGVEWLRSLDDDWVRTYELSKIVMRKLFFQQLLVLTDSDGRELAMTLVPLQEDRLMWDLVYNGILHSVITGGAEASEDVHRRLDLPYPRRVTGPA
jgi:hypothetical protein